MTVGRIVVARSIRLGTFPASESRLSDPMNDKPGLNTDDWRQNHDFVWPHNDDAWRDRHLDIGNNRKMRLRMGLCRGVSNLETRGLELHQLGNGQQTYKSHADEVYCNVFHSSLMLILASRLQRRVARSGVGSGLCSFFLSWLLASFSFFLSSGRIMRLHIENCSPCCWYKLAVCKVLDNDKHITRRSIGRPLFIAFVPFQAYGTRIIPFLL